MSTPAAAHTTKPPKYSGDGSKPFTMQEIENRILQVFSLPTNKINKKSVENIFGVILKGSEIDSYYEEISADKTVVFTIDSSRRSSGQDWFIFTINGKK